MHSHTQSSKTENTLSTISLDRLDWAWIIGIFLIIRVILSLIGVFTLQGQPIGEWSFIPDDNIYATRPLVVPDWGWISDYIFNGWYRWDTGWYLKIAVEGYALDGSTIFPPLYPYLIRFTQPLFAGNYLLAGLVISNIAAFSAVTLLYRLSLLEGFDRDATRRAIFLWVAFPTGFYLFAGYTESLYLAFALGAIWMARKDRWVWAGVLAAIGALTRLQGWLLIIIFGWILLVGNDAHRENSFAGWFRLGWRGLTTKYGLTQFWMRVQKGGWVALVLPVAAFVGYSFWLEAAGLGTITSAYQQYWDMQIVPPWEWLAQVVHIFNEHGWTPGFVIDFFPLVLFLFLAVLSLSKLNPGYSAFLFVSIVTVMMRGFTHPLAGVSRYVLALFPVFWVLAGLVKNKWLFISVITVFFLVQTFLMWLFFRGFWVA